MDVIFAPWRLEYILSDKKQDACIFCEMVSSPVEQSQEMLVVHRSDLSIVALNKYPYNNGHLMAAPKRHVATVNELSDPEMLDLFAMLKLCEAVLEEKMRPEGFNIGINIGRCAGAGVLGHIHIHVVPRFSGDSNFMTTVSESRVIPELLNETFLRLRPGFAALSASDDRST